MTERIAPEVPSTLGLDPQLRGVLDALKARSDMQMRRMPGLPVIGEITVAGSTPEIQMLIDKINQLLRAMQI